MRKHVILLLACGLVPSAVPSLAHGQMNLIPFPRLVPFRSTALPAPPADPTNQTVDYHRLLEMLTELAWLGDPLTFPCLLEARVVAGTLRVRGKVPDEAVREQALKLARLSCPMKIIDELKPGPPACEALIGIDPGMLQQAAETAVREAFPGAPCLLCCQADGKVVVRGYVKSYADKLAISKRLQRLHG